jgi:hypothetical protein
VVVDLVRFGDRIWSRQRHPTRCSLCSMREPQDHRHVRRRTVRPELSFAESLPRWYPLRDKAGRHEIDLVIEFGGGRVAGIEIKANAVPGRADARHLVWLREELGDRFLPGVVLHTGPSTFELADRIFAAPVSTLWKYE